jgi:PhzF family phenazine biosynthesis protein
VKRNFRQVDVFTTVPYLGNPLAVVLDGTGLTTAQMQHFAHWTNLSETTFLLPPSVPGADYAVRIFTPTVELPFAGHPTLGSCHAWLASGHTPAHPDGIVQECAAGLINLRQTADGLAFAAPPLIRSGPVDEAEIQRIASILGVERSQILAAEWADNGPGWVAVLLDSVDTLMALKPAYSDYDLGLVATYRDGERPAGALAALPKLGGVAVQEDGDIAIEVRAFFPKDGSVTEDPVTGSLNASLAQWLLASGRLQAPYTASQGTALGRAGRIHVSQDADGTIWVGGGTVTCIEGRVEL